MSLTIEELEIKPGDHFIVKWCGSIEESIVISAWENGHIMVSGPFNCNHKRFFFSKDGVEEILDSSVEPLP